MASSRGLQRRRPKEVACRLSSTMQRAQLDPLSVGGCDDLLPAGAAAPAAMTNATREASAVRSSPPTTVVASAKSAGGRDGRPVWCPGLALLISLPIDKEHGHKRGKHHRGEDVGPLDEGKPDVQAGLKGRSAAQ